MTRGAGSQGLADFPRTRPLAPRAGRNRVSRPARGRHHRHHTTESRLWIHGLPLPAAEPARPEGWRLAELGSLPQVLSPRPLTRVPRSKVLRLGARARKGLEMMSQKRGALLVPLPRGLAASGGQRVDPAGGGRDAATRPRLSRLLRARRRSEPALPPPFLSGSGSAQAQPLGCPLAFDPACGRAAEALVALEPRHLRPLQV